MVLLVVSTVVVVLWFVQCRIGAVAGGERASEYGGEERKPHGERQKERKETRLR